MEKEIINQVNAFVEQLSQLREMHEQLLLAVRGKQKTMRSGDMNGLSSWSAREQFLIERIQRIDEERKHQAKFLAPMLRLTDPNPTLTLIAGHLPEPHRSRLLAQAGAIRATAEQIYQTNQVNDAVTREILDCFAQMQRQITAAHCDIGLYDPNGHKQMSNAVNILDAVG